MYLVVLFTQYCSGDKIEKDEVGGASITYVGEERHIREFGGVNLRKRDHLEYPYVDGRIILKYIFRK
jgi:hypothetical protein